MDAKDVSANRVFISDKRKTKNSDKGGIMKIKILSISLAFCAGLVLTVQNTINSQIGKSSSQFIMIVGISLTQALIGMLILLIGKQPISSMFSPWIVLSGIMGIAVLYGFSFSISSIGTLKVFALVLFGQVLASLVIDNFGYFGVNQTPVSVQRVLFSLVIISGVIGLVRTQ